MQPFIDIKFDCNSCLCKLMCHTRPQYCLKPHSLLPLWMEVNLVQLSSYLEQDRLSALSFGLLIHQLGGSVVTEFVTSIEAKNCWIRRDVFAKPSQNFRRLKFLMNEGSSKFSCAKCQFLQILCLFIVIVKSFKGCSGQIQVEPLKMLILNV